MLTNVEEINRSARYKFQVVTACKRCYVSTDDVNIKPNVKDRKQRDIRQILTNI